jgi:hypothetical protein|tara:strand:- start:16654 stop:16851 length:198 start_codon:yes stop_codon:yes gene_type:complete
MTYIHTATEHGNLPPKFDQEKRTFGCLFPGRTIGVDMVSNELYQSMISGDVQAMIFFVKIRIEEE